MRRLLLLTFAWIATADAGINLSATPSEYVSEGITYTQLSFKDDDRVVTYVPPQLWRYGSSATQVQLTPPKDSRARATIEATPLETEQALDEKAIDALKEPFMATLPPASQGGKLLSEEQNPLLLSGNIPTYELTASFQALGETFVRSTMFANAGKTQLRFTLTARKSDFAALQRAFRSSVISWQWSEKKPPQVATAQSPAP
jgi:hypothetical protein